jgi:hypothetical protein
LGRAGTGPRRDVWNEALRYYGRLQQDGKIERVDVVVLTSTGGEVGGFILVRGTAQQIDPSP